MQTERYDIDAKPPESSKSIKSMPPYPKAPPNDEQREMLQSLLAERFQLKYDRETREGPVYLLVKGSKALHLSDSKDKTAYPWAGGLGGGMIMGDGLAGINESMEDLAKRLSPYLGRPVLDRTGLTGSFDFRSEYSSDNGRPDVITMILASVQDIGLKLEHQKGQSTASSSNTPTSRQATNLSKYSRFTRRAFSSPAQQALPILKHIRLLESAVPKYRPHRAVGKTPPSSVSAHRQD